MDIKRQISIPVIREVGIELVLRMPMGEEVAVNKKNFLWCLTGRLAVLTFRSVREMKDGYNSLCWLIRQGGNGLIPVKLAGKGPTEKSKKVRISGVVYRYQTPNGEVEERKEHTLTIPASQIIERDAQCFVPRWLLKKTIHKRVFEGKGWPTSIEGGVWFGADDLWNTVFAPLGKEINAEIEEQERRQTVRLRAEKKTVASRKARIKIEAVARAAAEAERQREKDRLEAKKADRMNCLEHIQVERVEWDEWVSFKNQYGSKSHKKVTRSFQNCTLRFSGQRVYIETQGGCEIIKTRATVRWDKETSA